ncbi:migration and invasion-inhibitory protein [Solea senegalensis]|uniref:Migration and invasion-inhibitory protein n=1 Tax=Solea senegalensis TaxID=28829 RepID=A0AAV6QNS8_SOLSE|nr:migration and invasion-inhibitory protein isoform X2 [Solea senegalensis]KAG7493665.1 migration and invasion-inhibitory protein [Solea senegalensis]
MSSSSRLDLLRERNKDLLKQLKEQSEKLELLRGYFRSREEDGDGEAEAEARSRSEEVVVTRTDGERGPAQAALSEQTTLKFADLCDNKTGTESNVPTPPVTSKCERTTQQTDSPPDSDGRLRVQETSPHGLKSCLAKNNKEQREMQRRVTFQSHDCEEPAPDCEVPATDRHHLQPLLGYDWIAGVLDSEDTVTQCSDEFFNDLHVFRSLYKDECVHSSTAEFSEENQSGLDLLTDKDDPQAHTDTHKCTFSYRINSRLFPAPLHSRECCPVCKKHKSSHPHTTADPALIRVSLPRSTVLPPHKYKAHRRCSFDPTDSLGLPSHCLSGWSHTAQSTVPPPSSLDMRSSLNTKSSAQVTYKELEDASTPQMSADQIANVSKLPRHNFRHFSPKRKKIGNTSYQVC